MSAPVGRTISAVLVAVVGLALAIYLRELSRRPISDRAFVLILILFALMSLCLHFSDRWSALLPGRSENQESLQLLIAISQLALFGATLVLAGVAAAMSSAQADKWLDVFKSGFLLLGGGLTTITGYYFGSRQTRQAVDKGAAISEREAASARSDGNQEVTDSKPKPKGKIKKPANPPTGGSTA